MKVAFKSQFILGIFNYSFFFSNEFAYMFGKVKVKLIFPFNQQAEWIRVQKRAKWSQTEHIFH